jgi:hypothetical protein
MQRHTLVEQGTDVMFLGPHRTWSSSQLYKISISSALPSSFGELLMRDELPHVSLPGLPGLQGGIGSRAVPTTYRLS